MTTSIDPCNKTLESFDTFTKKCENYLSANDAAAENIKSYLKALYNVTKKSEKLDELPQGDTLPELIVDSFDEEQIWQELELQNEARIDSLVGDVARLVAQKDSFSTALAANFDEVEEEESEDETLNDDNGSLSSDDSGSENDASQSEEDSNNEDEDSPNEDSPNEETAKTKLAISNSKSKSKQNNRSSIVDDKFFKLSEMEEFLKLQERRGGFPEENGSSDESIDLFDDIPSSDETEEEEDEEEPENDTDDDTQKGVHYSDFFDAPDGAETQSKERNSKKAHVVPVESESEVDEDESISSDKIGNSKQNDGEIKKKVRMKLNDNSDGEDDDSLSDLSVPDNDGIKSSFEKRQERIQSKIKDLEEQALSEKPWQLKGEVSAESRPQDALLEEALEFDATTRPAPVMTEETTKRLEDIIKQRIKDRSWDDVVRKEKPMESAPEYKKRLVLDQEKSKLSLAQVYEQEYLQKVASTDPDAADRPEEIPKEHIEIKNLVDSLFHKLDALSNFHYTPKQVNPEVKIVTNIPAISMEEVAPLATSDATLLAPEEVKAKPQGDVISAVERTDTDKKRERRKKKQHQRVVAREREKREAIVSKLKPGLGNKYSKEKAMKLLDKVSKDKNVSLMEGSSMTSATKSSTAFFSQLQEEVTSNIREKIHIKKKRKEETAHLSAKRLKL